LTCGESCFVKRESRLRQQADGGGRASSKTAALRVARSSGISSPPDNHVLACAVTGNVNLIVSKDLDLLRRKAYGTIGIMSPIDFLNTLGEVKKAA
jgi:predicted nucleic acid-binding protein